MIHLLAALHLLLDGRRRDDEGATMVEYGLLVSLIAVVVGVAAATFGTQLALVYTNVSGSI
jgi:pilus assembly protein Flp/PilA